MLNSNQITRAVFVLAIVLNLFTAPWWLTFVWCLAGCVLFPLFLEAAVVMLFFDGVFAPGLPMLSILIVLTIVITDVVHYSFDTGYVDFS
jgi:hypothetical protein